MDRVFRFLKKGLEDMVEEEDVTNIKDDGGRTFQMLYINEKLTGIPSHK
jgi:hypothetical protein